jgi:hypothetical protein
MKFAMRHCSGLITTVAAVVALGALCLQVPANAQETHEAHVHGVGQLDVAIDGNRLTLYLDSPLVNLLGFEHPAVSAPDRLAAQTMSRRLRAPASLFVPTAAAQCTPLPVKLVSDALAPALLDPDGPAPQATPTGKNKPAAQGEHADLDANFAFQCAHPDQLRTLEVKLFRVFPGFHRIEAQIVTPQRQSAASLEPGAAIIKF